MNLIIQARRANIEEYLRSKGKILVREGKQYRVRNHPGLVVSGNKWYNHTLSRGGNTLDYLIEIEGTGFKKAVEILLQGSTSLPVSDKPAKDNRLVLPERNTDDKRVIAYLVKTRGISAEIVIPLLKEGRIYEAAGIHNAVFTGIDENNKTRYAMQRSTLPGCSLKFESAGSDKRYSFSLKGKSDTIYLFESPIDLLSYMTLHTNLVGRHPHMLSLGGVSDIALDAYLEKVRGINTIVFCLDRDKAGNDACSLLCNKYRQKGYETRIHPPRLKDWNTDLLYCLQLPQPSSNTSEAKA